MKTGGFREVFNQNDGRAPLPELPLVGWARLDRIRVPGLEAHAHPDVLEVFLIERGRVEWWVEAEATSVPVNHLYLNRPGERHGSLGHGLKPCGYLWFQLRMPPRARLPGLAPAAAARLLADLRALRRRSFVASPATRAAFRALWEAHREPPVLHAETALRARLHLLLVQILLDHAAAEKPAAGRPSFAIARALRLIEARPAEIESVAELAAAVKLGVSRFAERFYSETGFTPAGYLRLQRIELAKRLIRDGKRTLTEIAQASGFSSSQHLATVFRRTEGMTPSAFQKRRPSASTAATSA